MTTPLIIDDQVRKRISDVCDLARDRPVEMTSLSERLQTPEGKAAHRQQMTEQTVEIPVAFLVTFSIERGHPCGSCRHLSMSIQRAGRVPSLAAVWMVAQEFGFWNALASCSVWLEQFEGHGTAVNLVQPLKTREPFSKLPNGLQTYKVKLVGGPFDGGFSLCSHDTVYLSGERYTRGKDDLYYHNPET